MTAKRKAITMVLLLGYGYGTVRSQTDSSIVPRAPSRVWAANNFLSTISLPSEGLQIFNFRDYNPLEAVIDSADLLVEEARQHLGKPYRYGGKGPKAFDCAGFARYVRGDLVFFQGRSGKGGVGHTGIVTEVDTNTGVFRFIHAATSTGVIHSYSTEAYYAQRYIGARRLLGDRRKPEDPLPRKRRE